MIRIILTFIVLYAFFYPALWAASYTWSGYKEINAEEVILTISGEINSSDADKLLDNVLSHRYISEIVLNSPGGSVLEALKMATVISGLRVATRVARDKTCASSCFFLYLAGEPRHASGMSNINGVFYGRLGLHRPYLTKEYFQSNSNDTSSKNQEELMTSVKNYLEKQMVPTYLIEIMMRRSSNEIYFLSDSDLNALGEVYLPREELFTAKCGYKRNQTFDPMALIAGISKELACVQDIQTNDQFLFFEKLKTGWKPWSKETIVRRNLVKSFSNHEFTIYLDKNSIEKNGSIVKYDEISDLKSPMITGSGESKVVVGSVIDSNEVDCSKLRMRTIKSISYSDSLGKGQISYSDYDVKTYKSFQLGSQIHKSFCAK